MTHAMMFTGVDVVDDKPLRSVLQMLSVLVVCALILPLN